MPVLLNHMYGRLFTISRVHHILYGDDTTPRRPYWLCNCSCGTAFVIVRGDQLVTGRTSSCGCSRRTSLGLSGTPTYNTWAAMRRRCGDVNHPRYADYGGRGIKVCRRWNNSRTGFASFVEDMGLRPDDRTLDRIRVNEGYSKDNCKWATLVEQRWNRRDMVKSRADGDAAEYAYWDQVEQEDRQVTA